MNCAYKIVTLSFLHLTKIVCIFTETQYSEINQQKFLNRF